MMVVPWCHSQDDLILVMGLGRLLLMCLAQALLGAGFRPPLRAHPSLADQSQDMPALGRQGYWERSGRMAAL